MARQILGKVVPTGEDTYDNSRTYDELCIVMYNGQSYISKKETSYVESWNNKLRSNLSKLNRDTQRFPKSKKALEDSIWLLGNREFVVGIIFWQSLWYKFIYCK